MYNEVQQKVYEELQQAPNICLTTDIWTSQANQAYMTIIAHFIDLKNNKIKNVVLVRRELIGNHTIEFIVEQLENTRSTGSIGEKIICLAFDTYPTMRKVILEHFGAATRKLASDSSPILSIILSVLTILITSLEDRPTDSSLLKKIKHIFHGYIEEQFKKTYNNKLGLLYPHWKNFQRSSYKNYVERLSLLNKLQAFEAKQLAYLYLQEQYNSLLENNLVTSFFQYSTTRRKRKRI
ncbi:unnamed protein product [Rotaria sordida]|uniref:Uncharacterized protein n=1 Tax=Rotaria sordida TaxID=392033 RepID=A0A819EGP9_9BILA|nr:unnamed protein product [Rotaria sordida]